MINLLNILGKYSTLYECCRNIYYRFIVRPYCNIILFFYNLKLNLIEERKSYEDERYKKIRELKDKHKGQRCFIVATGSSVRMEDLMAIKDELSISMNSIVNIMDKTEYRPTYYMIQDYTGLKKLYNNIKRLPSSTYKFLGINNTRCPDFNYAKKIIKKDKTFHLYRLNFAILKKQGNMPIKETEVGFSWDCGREIMDGYTVVYSAIQLAVYMGVREIYLIGCDCDYSRKVNHIGECIEPEHEYSNKTEARLIHSHVCAYSHLKGKVNIYNATRGGQLEVFPRINFDDLIKQNRG